MKQMQIGLHYTARLVFGRDFADYKWELSDLPLIILLDQGKEMGSVERDF
jgi:hypothetical protein